MNETGTLDELMAEILPQWLIEVYDEMIIYVSNNTEDLCDGEAEDEYIEKEDE